MFLKNCTKNTHAQTAGFTLIETLVAISILMIGLAGTFSVVQMGLASATAVKDRITAAFLVQEALEAARNMKDQNLLAENQNARSGGDGTSPDWLAGLVDPSPSPSNGCSSDGSVGCDYNFGSATPFITCPSGGCPLYLDTDGILKHSAGVVSRFSRIIKVTQLPAIVQSGGEIQKEAQITVTVTWPGSSLTVSDNITNWFAP